MLHHQGFVLRFSPTCTLSGIHCGDHGTIVSQEILERLRWHVNGGHAKWVDAEEQTFDFCGYRYKVAEMCPMFGITKLARIGKMVLNDYEDEVFVPQTPALEINGVSNWGAW